MIHAANRQLSNKQQSFIALFLLVYFLTYLAGSVVACILEHSVMLVFALNENISLFNTIIFSISSLFLSNTRALQLKNGIQFQFQFHEFATRLKSTSLRLDTFIWPELRYNNSSRGISSSSHNKINILKRSNRISLSFHASQLTSQSLSTSLTVRRMPQCAVFASSSFVLGSMQSNKNKAQS